MRLSPHFHLPRIFGDGRMGIYLVLRDIARNGAHPKENIAILDFKGCATIFNRQVGQALYVLRMPARGFYKGFPMYTVATYL